MRLPLAILLLSIALHAAGNCAERPVHYTPVDRAFVCTDGTARYTRALYGGAHTEYRLETSDRPAFAIYKKKACRNISFYLNGTPLNSLAHCTARYENAGRTYTISHLQIAPEPDRFMRDGKMSDQREENSNCLPAQENLNSYFLILNSLCASSREAAVWRVQGTGALRVVLAPTATQKFFRSGDIGVDPSTSFDAATDQPPLAVLDLTLTGEPVYLAVLGTDTLTAGPVAKQLYDEAEAYNRALCSRLAFTTPEAGFDAVAPALCAAADAIWDGATHTWLHGAVGWRMPLAGWRAGYTGDVLGWDDRADEHFRAYAKSQVTDRPCTLPHPQQDPAKNLARAKEQWGTPMYSNGYICRYPGKADRMHHYDMNLNYVDALLRHLQHTGDTAEARHYFPLLQRHLAYERAVHDPDGDHLYDAYCCIWASDALYYSGGAVTHSSAYNYMGNLLTARIARLLGEDDTPYRQEADDILAAMNARLWLPQGHWAEYQDLMGLQRRHEAAALWSIYTPIDCGAATPQQAYQATQYIDRELPHFNVSQNVAAQTVATTTWLPYAWSTNNVAPAEVYHTALAMFQAGNTESGMALLRGNILDQMCLGASPGNFGQLSYYDAARGECYRDFGDCIGMAARAFVEGLFGIQPQALDGRCIVRPGFTTQWDTASVSTPYLSYSYRRRADGNATVTVRQAFARPLTIVYRQNLAAGQYRDIIGTDATEQTFTLCDTVPASPLTSHLTSSSSPLAHENLNSSFLILNSLTPHLTSSSGSQSQNLNSSFLILNSLDITPQLNADVAATFRTPYLTPRPPYTTLQIPTQGFGNWCNPNEVPDISNATLRRDTLLTAAGVPFRTHTTGNNIAYTSLWDNYPDSLTFPAGGQWQQACFLMAGTTNQMQSRIDNAVIYATYTDGTTDTLTLRNPDNWCPLEQDYYIDNHAFAVRTPRPCRLALATGLPITPATKRSDDQTTKRPDDFNPDATSAAMRIPGGAATILHMPLNPKKALRGFTLRTLSNDIVVGIIAITLCK